MGQDFVDRFEEIRRIKSLIYSNSKIFVLGLRGYGKSSLLKRVVREIREEGYIGVYIDCLKIYDGRDLISEFVRELERVGMGENFSLLKELKILAKNIEPRDALDAFLEYCSKAGVKVVVFDEISTLIKRFSLFKPYRRMGGVRAVGEHLKSILDRANFSIIAVDTSINFIYQLFIDYTSPLFRQFSAFIEVKPLDIESSIELVEKIASSKGLELSMDVVLKIVEYSGGVPQYIKMITDLIYENLSVEKLENIIHRDLLDGSLNIYFRALFDKFSSSEQEVLLIMSRGYKRFSEIADKAVNAAMALDSLEKKGIVIRIQKNRKLVYYTIKDKLFALWLSLQELPRIKKLAIDRAKIYYLGLEAIVREIFLTLKNAVELVDETGEKIVIEPTNDVLRYEGSLGEVDLIAISRSNKTYVGEVYGGFNCPSKKVDELLKNMHIAEKIGYKNIIGRLISYIPIPQKTIEYIKSLQTKNIPIYALTKKQLKILSRESKVKI